MNGQNPPQYDFSNPVFSQRRNYMLYAKEHIELWDLQQNSDVIDFEIKSTVSSLNIPTVYHVIYKLRSITAIDSEAQPIYGDEHLMELSIPPRYPLESAQIYMRTPVWHPNIQSEGRFVGKICGNVKDYGIDYGLRQLVLRVGEILQYKNYLADFVPPYPEDPKVAEWVKAYGEPRGIVDRSKGICTDDQPLIRPNRQDAGPVKIVVGEATAEPVEEPPTNTAVPPPVPLPVPPPVPTPDPSEESAEAHTEQAGTKEESPSSGIKIKRMNQDAPPPERRKIVLGKPKAKKEKE
ncbi:MAG: ubiquitin-conjugating enzyme E2 [Bacteroidota bacterium]